MVLFYLLLVWLSPANFSWLWFAIAILMQIVQSSSRSIDFDKLRQQIEDNNNWRGGPYA